MDQTFLALGVEFDLTKVRGHAPHLRVKNKPGRIQELKINIQKHLDENRITPAEAAQL